MCYVLWKEYEHDQQCELWSVYFYFVCSPYVTL